MKNKKVIKEFRAIELTNEEKKTISGGIASLYVDNDGGNHEKPIIIVMRPR